MKNIDIIIPCYNSVKTLFTTLSSIAMQSIKDQCNIYICDDCGTDDYTDVIYTFSNLLNITYLKSNKNSGAGVTRQLGIDNSTGKYLLFIDSDDTLADTFSLEKLYSKIEETNADVVVGNFKEQAELNGKLTFVTHKLNSVWLHGKIFRRSFIQENNIRFNNTRLNEDVYFNGLIWATTKNIVHLDYVVAMWLTNNNSLTRNTKDDLARYKVLVGYVENQIKLYLEKKNRGIKNTGISLQQSVDGLLVSYFYCNEIFYTWGEKIGNDFLNICREFYKNVWNEIQNVATNEYLNERYYNILTNMASSRQFIPIVSLYDFVNEISN